MIGLFKVLRYPWMTLTVKAETVINNAWFFRPLLKTKPEKIIKLGTKNFIKD